MADKFVSGQTTNRYDPIVSDDVKNKLDELDKNNELVKETFKAHENMINALAKQLGDAEYNAPVIIKQVMYQEIGEEIVFYRNTRNQIDTIVKMYPIILRILSSRLMRFLNYFGHWYGIGIQLVNVAGKVHGHYAFYPYIDTDKEQMDRLRETYKNNLKSFKKSGGTHKQLVNGTVKYYLQ